MAVADENRVSQANPLFEIVQAVALGAERGLAVEGYLPVGCRPSALVGQNELIA